MCLLDFESWFSAVTSCDSERNNSCVRQGTFLVFTISQAFCMNKPLGSERERVGQKREIINLLLIKPGRWKEIHSGKYEMRPNIYSKPVIWDIQIYVLIKCHSY